MSTKKLNKRGITRRDFIKWSAAAGAAGSAVDWATTGLPTASAANPNYNYDTITTCPYCSVGCNMKVAVDGGKVVDIIGDPDCPINNGALCSKGSAAIQLVNNDRRVGVPNSIHAASQSNGTDNKGPMVRRGSSTTWESLTWDEALNGKAGDPNPRIVNGIAEELRLARSGAGTWQAGGKVIGQAQGVAFLGCSHATNEENWLYRKVIANFGTNNIEHQARI